MCQIGKYALGYSYPCCWTSPKSPGIPLYWGDCAKWPSQKIARWPKVTRYGHKWDNVPSEMNCFFWYFLGFQACFTGFALFPLSNPIVCRYFYFFSDFYFAPPLVVPSPSVTGRPDPSKGFHVKEGKSKYIPASIFPSKSISLVVVN